MGKVDRCHRQHRVTPMLSWIWGDRHPLQKWMDSASANRLTPALSPDPSTVTGTG